MRVFADEMAKFVFWSVYARLRLTATGDDKRLQ
jgi:hypothetical protein